MPAPLAVTGATGRIGGAVSNLLADAGVPHRLLVRDPDRAPDVLGTTVHRAAYEDSVDTRAALDGVQTLFMVSATEHPDRRDQHRAFADAAEAMGVQHVVYLSFFGAGPEATFTFARDHWATERHLRSTGMAVTFLRDNLYADFLPRRWSERTTRLPGREVPDGRPWSPRRTSPGPRPRYSPNRGRTEAARTTSPGRSRFRSRRSPRCSAGHGGGR